MAMAVNPKKPVSVVLNMVVIVILVSTALFYMGLFTDLGAKDGSMRSAVAISVVLVSDVGLLALGIVLFIAGRKGKISFPNRVLPLFAIPIVTYPDFMQGYSDTQVGVIGVVVSLLLTGAMVVFSLQIMKKENAGQTQ